MDTISPIRCRSDCCAAALSRAVGLREGDVELGGVEVLERTSVESGR